MFKLFILSSFLAASNAYLSHGPAILNHPNYGLYHGGYSVKDYGPGLHQPNYLAPYRPHGYIPGIAKAAIPIPAPLPAPVPVIQKLGHTGYAYAPAPHLPIPHAPIAPIALPQVHPNAYAPAGYAGYHAGYHAGAQANYVVAPSVSFSQNAPKQIAPAVPISKVVRIPYAFPNINSPHPISHPIPDPTHGW